MSKPNSNYAAALEKERERIWQALSNVGLGENAPWDEISRICSDADEIDVDRPALPAEPADPWWLPIVQLAMTLGGGEAAAKVQIALERPAEPAGANSLLIW